MQESKIPWRPKHVILDDRYHLALKKYAVELSRTSKDIVQEALEKMPGYKEFLK